MKKIIFALIPLLFSISLNALEKEKWTSLFDGETLEGWEIHGGKATYEVEDGAIVGTSAPNTRNTFLCVKKEYADFVLEYEYNPVSRLNSGVQFRSTIEKKVSKKRLADGDNGLRLGGYQCEIDPTKRKWSAGIFEEGRRGWLYPVVNKEAQAALKVGEWNKVRIVCLGPVIRTYLNGIPVSDFVDKGEKKGLIGLQIHGVGTNTTPLKIKWRNLKIRELESTDTTAVLEADHDTLGLTAPLGSHILLAPGKELEEWQLRSKKVGWMNKYVEGKLQWSVDKEKGVATSLPRTGSMDSKKHFGTQRIHVEFCTPLKKEGELQGASGNSGIYIQGSYELQICNTFGLEVKSDNCGGLYGKKAPDVNAEKKPGEWQVFDVYFIPASYDENRKKTAKARFSAKLNGKWIHRNVEIEGRTAGGDKETPSPRTLRLQDHQQVVKFRNVWVSDIDNPERLEKNDPRRKKKKKKSKP